jgi:integrase
MRYIQGLTPGRVDRTVLAGESIILFRAAVRNPITRDPYERRLINFLNTIGMRPDEFVHKAKMKPGEAEKKIISFVSMQNERYEKGEITAATVGNALKAIRLLLEMNDVTLNWTKIRRILPKARRYALDRTPTLEEMHKIIEAADFRGKALTLVFTSSGTREGAIQYLKVRDYTRVEQDGKLVAGRLIVYNGDPERYLTFITPEASFAIDKYLEFRAKHGEKITNESPLFRDKFDPIKGQYGHGKKDAKEGIIPMTAPSVRQYYNRLLFSIGIRNEKKRRHDFSVHGFRKYFKTRAEQSGMKPINVEILMGHSVGISDSYYRPTENELLEDYQKAVEYLTISEENRLRNKVMEEDKMRKIISTETQELASQLESKTQEILALRDTMDAMDMRLSQEFDAKLDSETRIIAMEDYIEDMHSQMRKLTKDINMLKETRGRLLPKSKKPADIGRGKELQIADQHP